MAKSTPASPTATRHFQVPQMPVPPKEYSSDWYNQVQMTQGLFFNQIINSIGIPVPFASFYSSVTQTNPVGGAVNALLLNSSYTPVNTDNFVYNPTNSKIFIRQNGIYNISFTANVSLTAGTNQTGYFWASVNGTNVPYSAAAQTVTATGIMETVSFDYLYQFGSSDYIQFDWLSSSTSMQLQTVAATALVPGVPSVMCSIAWVSDRI